MKKNKHLELLLKKHWRIIFLGDETRWLDAYNQRVTPQFRQTGVMVVRTITAHYAKAGPRSLLGGLYEPAIMRINEKK